MSKVFFLNEDNECKALKILEKIPCLISSASFGVCNSSHSSHGYNILLDIFRNPEGVMRYLK